MEVLNREIGSFLEALAEEENIPGLIYGFADTSDVATVQDNGTVLHNAISIACALSPSELSKLSNGFSEQYFNECIAASEKASEFASKLAELLRDKGFNAALIKGPLIETEPSVTIRESDAFASIPSAVFEVHRLAATHAGLGWIGKNGLVVTKHYGPAVMLATVFTDAPLDCATEVFLSRCGRCKECAKVCPAGAIDIFNRTSIDNIENMIDIELCAKECESLTHEPDGRATNFCGICIYACPYTKSYLSRKGYPYE